VSALAAAGAGLATSGERPWHWSILVQLGQSDLSKSLGGEISLRKWQQCWTDFRLKHWDINIPVVPHKAVAEVSKIGNL